VIECHLIYNRRKKTSNTDEAKALRLCIFVNIIERPGQVLSPSIL
jgi:hypothetical protein